MSLPPQPLPKEARGLSPLIIEWVNKEASRLLSGSLKRFL